MVTMLDVDSVVGGSCGRHPQLDGQRRGLRERDQTYGDAEQGASRGEAAILASVLWSYLVPSLPASTFIPIASTCLTPIPTNPRLPRL
ncbi:hypothetical protein PENSPDRAFT_659422 [Peniophora sp. CONT]|nr:hypothetical protein PENSPDRAFT_659422 [Peniophora sp. CONT]